MKKPPKKALNKKRCEECKKIFQPYRGWQKFCSDKCRFKNWISKNSDRQKLKDIKEKLTNLENRIKAIERTLGIKIKEEK